MSLETEVCPICLEEFKTQTIATPNGCSHKFCFLCLIKWAQYQIICPICRQLFTGINKIVKIHLSDLRKKTITSDEPETNTSEDEEVLPETNHRYFLRPRLLRGNSARIK